MAVVGVLEKKRMILGLDGGMKDGKIQIKKKGYAVVDSATNEDMYRVAMAITGLQQHSLLKLYNEELESLINE